MLKSLALRSGLFLCVLGSLQGQQFQDQTAARLPTQAIWTEGVCAGDVDGDGDNDLVYAKGDGFAGAGTARQSTICINNAGIFTDQTATRFPVLLANSKDIELLDVDNDGDLDVVLANAFVQQPRLWLNNGAGVFTDATAAQLPTMALNCFKVIGGDVDNDGDLDLLFTDSGASAFNGSGGQPRLYMNNGSGFFVDETATRLPAVLIISQLDADFSDVDGDSDLDLFVVSKEGTPSKLFINNGSGFFTNGPVLPSDGGSTYHYSLGDLDGDNDADIFIIAQNGLAEGVFVNNGAATYTLNAAAIVGNPSSDDNASALGDIDNDGDYDVAIAALSTADRLLVNNGAGVVTYNAALITNVSKSSLDIKFIDLDNDGDLDIVNAVGESGTFQNRVYMNVAGTPDTHAPVLRLQVLGAGVTAGAIPVRCGIRDILGGDTDPRYQSVTLNYSVNAMAGSAPMKWAGADLFRGVIPFAPIGATVMYSVTCVDRSGNSATSSTVTFSPTGAPSAPLLVITTTGVGDLAITIYNPSTPSAEEFLFPSTLLPPVLGSGPFFGLGADAFNFVFTPIGVPPVHDYLNAAGLQATSFGPGTLPLGFMFDARGVLLATPSPVWTNILRVTL